MFSVFHLSTSSKITVLVFLIQWIVVWCLLVCENILRYSVTLCLLKHATNLCLNYCFRCRHTSLPCPGNSWWAYPSQQNGSWELWKVCRVWGVYLLCILTLFRVLWITRYAVVNDENVDSPSLVISEIPICHADYYCYFLRKITFLC